jgi:thiamine pyrophosphokinase
LQVDHLVGDLDSVSAEARQAVEAAGGTVELHPRAKDETDLELAMCAAASLGPARIIVIGGHGQRLDHHLAGLLLLAAPWLAPVAVTAWHGSALVSVIRGGDTTTLHGDPGSLASLVPVAGDASGLVTDVTTDGLAYPLAGESLALGTTRGVSNVLVGESASVAVGTGVVLAVQPDAIAHHLAAHRDGEPWATDPEEHP